MEEQERHFNTCLQSFRAILFGFCNALLNSSIAGLAVTICRERQGKEQGTSYHGTQDVVGNTARAESKGHPT